VEYGGDHRFIQRLTLLRNREHTSPGEESRASAKTHSEHHGFVLPQLECILGDQDPRSIQLSADYRR